MSTNANNSKQFICPLLMLAVREDEQMPPQIACIGDRCAWYIDTSDLSACCIYAIGYYLNDIAFELNAIQFDMKGLKDSQ